MVVYPLDGFFVFVFVFFITGVNLESKTVEKEASYILACVVLKVSFCCSNKISISP